MLTMVIVSRPARFIAYLLIFVASCVVVSSCASKQSRLASAVGVDSTKILLAKDPTVLEAEVQQGHETQAWLYAIAAAHEGGSRSIQNCCSVLDELRRHNTANVIPACALLEEAVIEHPGEDLDKYFIILSYCQFSPLPTDSREWRRGFDLGEAVAHNRALDDDARKFCEEQITSNNIARQHTAFSILVAAGDLQGEPKRWAQSLCETQLKRPQPPNRRIWNLIYECITGHYYSSS